MKETFIENEFNSDSDGILTASYVIPLVPTQIFLMLKESLLAVPKNRMRTVNSLTTS